MKCKSKGKQLLLCILNISMGDCRNSIDGGRIIYALDTEKLQALDFPTFPSSHCVLRRDRLVREHAAGPVLRESGVQRRFLAKARPDWVFR